MKQQTPAVYVGVFLFEKVSEAQIRTLRHGKAQYPGTPY